MRKKIKGFFIITVIILIALNIAACGKSQEDAMTKSEIEQIKNEIKSEIKKEIKEELREEIVNELKADTSEENQEQSVGAQSNVEQPSVSAEQYQGQSQEHSSMPKDDVDREDDSFYGPF